MNEYFSRYCIPITSEECQPPFDLLTRTRSPSLFPSARWFSCRGPGRALVGRPLLSLDRGGTTMSVGLPASYLFETSLNGEPKGGRSKIQDPLSKTPTPVQCTNTGVPSLKGFYSSSPKSKTLRKEGYVCPFTVMESSNTNVLRNKLTSSSFHLSTDTMVFSLSTE